MNSLIMLTMLVATTHPSTLSSIQTTVSYQVVTNEFEEYSAYSFEGIKILSTPQNEVYSLNMAACDIHNNHYDVIDETLLFNNAFKKPRARKNSFYFERDYVGNRCLLVVQRKPLVQKPMYYNYDHDYWYPSYNHILTYPRQKTKIYVPRQTRNKRFHKKYIAHNARNKPKLVIKRKLPKKPKHKNHRKR